MSFRRQHIRNTRAVIEAGTPLIGEYPYDTDLKTIRAGDGVTLGGHLLAKWGKRKTVTPAQIVVNQNDYNPADLSIAEVLELTSDAARNITGIAGGATDRVLMLVNAGAFTITLKDADAGSVAGNRFSFGADFKLRAKMAIALIYLASSSRWFLLSDAFAWKYANDIPEDLSLSGDISPAQLVANTNDYAPAGLDTSAVLRLSTDASRNLTGITGGRDGRVLIVRNVGANALVLKDADAGSAAANRFDFGADITLFSKNHAVLQYDATDSRWKMLANTAGIAVADGAVTAVKLANSALGFSMVNGSLVATVAGNALTIAIKTLAGTDPTANDPVKVVFRNATAATGDYVVRSITAATSLVISSGSSLGSINNAAFRLWIVGFDDAGVFRLGAINCLSATSTSASIYPLAGWGIASSTAEGGAGGADSTQIFYTGAAVAAKAYATLGYFTWEAGLAAAGTWSAGPTRGQLFRAGVPLPGTPVQTQRASTGAVATGTTVMVNDDTIPQNTEGFQVMSQAVTPTSAANALNVRSIAQFAHSASVGTMILALFQDLLPDALRASILSFPGSSFLQHGSLWHMTLAGSSAQITFKIRIGANAAGTTTFNGSAGAALMGGVFNSFLEIEELMA